MNFEGGLLLDESVNLGDISTSSFGTPLPAKEAPDFDDSPITQPRFLTEDDESGDKRVVTPSSPFDDKAPTWSKGADVDATPQHIPKKNQIPTLKGDPEPQTPSRRSKLQITMETETITVSTKRTLFITR